MAFELMYEAMKRAIESEEFSGLGLKTASQNLVYCKQEPYFWTLGFFEGWKEQGQEAGTKYVRLDLSMKYCHYDELQNSIIYPGHAMKFSNKLRANSKMKCRDRLWSKAFLFPWDDDVQDFDALAREILRTAVSAVNEIFAEAEQLGSLDKYFIAHPELNPRLSAFACIENKQYKEAYEILKAAGASKEVLLVHADTEERLARLHSRYPEAQEGAATFGRDYHDIILDYCTAMEQNLSWNEELVLYSLPR